ncbi:MAG: hypothetical protein ABI769_07520 [Pseudomonadota bacterium]
MTVRRELFAGIATLAFTGPSASAAGPAPQLVEKIRAMTAEQITSSRQGLIQISKDEPHNITKSEWLEIARFKKHPVVTMAEIDVDKSMVAQGCSADDIFEIVIDLEEQHHIKMDVAEYGSDGNTTDGTLTVRKLAALVEAHLARVK